MRSGKLGLAVLLVLATTMVRGDEADDSPADAAKAKEQYDQLMSLAKAAAIALDIKVVAKDSQSLADLIRNLAKEAQQQDDKLTHLSFADALIRILKLQGPEESMLLLHLDTQSLQDLTTIGATYIIAMAQGTGTKLGSVLDPDGVAGEP